MTNKEYWKKRAEADLIASEKSVLEFEDALEKVYKEALIAIQKEVDAFFYKYAKENKISYAEARKRLTVDERANFNVLLTKWYKMAKELGLKEHHSKYLKDMGARVYISRLEALEASIRHEIELIKSEQYSQMTELMKTNYMVGYYSEYYTMSKGMSNGVDFAQLDKANIENAVKARRDNYNYSDRIWADKDALLRELSTTLPREIAMGRNGNSIGDVLAKKLGVSKNRARTLARTELNYIQNKSRLDAYKAAGITKYEYLATLDMRTSAICREMDGYIGDVSRADTGVNYPPMHPNCRSTTIPYFEDGISEVRSARDENGDSIYVPRRTTQEEWINKYAPEDQRERLLKFKNKFSR